MVNSMSKIVERVFEAEFEKAHVRKEEKKWINSFPENKIRALESAAKYIMKELGHEPLSEYQGKKRFPPCSIMRSASGKPSNCVGRVASLVLLSQIKNYEISMGKRLMIEIEVDYKQKPSGGKKVKGGHITAYTDLWGDKEYLGTRYDYAGTESYRVDMLPAVYALQTALARIRQERYMEAKKLAELSVKWSNKKSPYINHIATKIEEAEPPS